MSPFSGLLLARRYQLDSPIAAGGFGEVWRAADVLLGRPVAIKLLQAGYLQHPETLARFRAEARHTAGLSHPNVAHIYDYGEPDPPHPPFLVMELVDGPPLAEVLASGAMAPARAMDIVAQAANGLQAAHRAGLVHRDIKPGNLLLSGRGLVKITDFGIAHAAGSAPVTGTGLVMGTPAYLAPERVRGSSATAASDLYALGIVGYECLAGIPPFTGVPVAVALAHRDSPLPPLPASVPADVAALVTDLTAKDPAARPASAAEVAARAGQLRDRMLGRSGAWAEGAAAGQPATADDQLAGALAVARQRRRGGVWPARALAIARPRPRGGLRSARYALIAAAAVAVALLGLVLASAAGGTPPQRPAAAPSSTPASRPPAVQLVSVSSSALIGQPVSVAVRQLHRLGLKVRVLWRSSDQQRPGMVVSVSPAGQVPAGHLVTVTGAQQHGSAATTPQDSRGPRGRGERGGPGRPRHHGGPGHDKPHHHGMLPGHVEAPGHGRPRTPGRPAGQGRRQSHSLPA